jgi:hypothetical protein
VEKFLKMVLWLPRLAFDVTLSGRGILLIGLVSFLVIIVIAGHNYNALGAPLLPLFAALGAFPSALNDDFGWVCLAAVGRCFRFAQNKTSSNCLLTKGMSCGDIMQLLGGARLITAELMHQCTTRHAGIEHRDDIGVGHPWGLTTFLRETPNVISEGFDGLFPATLPIPGVAGLHKCALEVASESFLEVLPVVNDVSW